MQIYDGKQDRSSSDTGQGAGQKAKRRTKRKTGKRGHASLKKDMAAFTKQKTARTKPILAQLS